MVQATYYYRAFDLTICTDIVLPLVEIPKRSADIVIEQGMIPEQLEHITGQAALFTANNHEFLMHVPTIARYYVSDGNRIVYQPFESSDIKAIKTHLLASVMGALLHQRGYIVLHASAVEINGSVVLFSGSSGSGKSTAVTALVQKGHRFLGDDVTVLKKIAEGYAICTGYPFSRLWSDSLNAFDISSKGLEASMKSNDKFIVSNPSFEHQTLTVKALVLLKLNRYDEYILNKLSGADSVEALLQSVYRRKILYATHDDKQCFSEMMSVLKTLKVFELYRPCIKWNTDALEALVLKHCVSQ